MRNGGGGAPSTDDDEGAGAVGAAAAGGGVEGGAAAMDEDGDAFGAIVPFAGDGGAEEKKLAKWSLDETPLLPVEAVQTVAGGMRSDRAALCFSELALLFGDAEHAVKFERAAEEGLF